MGAQNSLSVHANQIADGLADKGYAVVDQFLEASAIDDILGSDELKEWKLHFKKAAVGKSAGRQVIEEIRGDYIQWIDTATASAPVAGYVHKLRTLIPMLNESLFLSLKDVEVHLTSYPVGTFYKRHLDQFRSDDHRKLSVICYLNKGWRGENGGQLRLHLPEGPLDIFPLAGRLACFRSDQVEHEVMPANRERMSLTGWMVDRVPGTT